MPRRRGQGEELGKGEARDGRNDSRSAELRCCCFWPSPWSCSCQARPMPTSGRGRALRLAGSFFAVFAAIGSALLTFITWPVRLLKRTLFGWRALRQEPLQARGHPRARRHGPRAHRDDARRGQAPAPGGAARGGMLQAAGHHGATALAGRLVDVSDRGQPRQAQHFRLPDARPAHAIARSSARSRSARRGGRSGSASTRFPWARPTSGCSARVSRSGASSASTGSSVASNGCRSRFPPEKLRGVLLSAMCVPDLRGTQGMFSYYTTRKRDEGEKIGGEVHDVVLATARPSAPI